MTDWIQVLLGQPLEEAREDSLEELNQAAETFWVQKRKAMSRAEALEADQDAGEAERTAQAARTGSAAELWDLGEGTNAEPAGRNSAGGGNMEAEAGERRAGEADEDGPNGTKAQFGGETEAAAGSRGAEQLEDALREARFSAAEASSRSGGTFAEKLERFSAGIRAAQAGQEEAQVWRQSGAEFLEAGTAGQQAEWAAAEAVRRTGGGRGSLAAALVSPEPRTPAAGRLLAVMEQNDRAAAYQTTAKITEQAENNAWTGSDPARLDLFFERDARRYDNGFTMF